MKNSLLEEIFGLSWHDKLPQAHGRPEYAVNIHVRTGTSLQEKDLLKLVIRERILSSCVENGPRIAAIVES